MTSLKPIQDEQTVTVTGDYVRKMIDGVDIRRAKTIPDDRGSICEIFNPAWGFGPDYPLVYVYQVTVRPGKIKGWVVHYTYDDRLFHSQGDVRWVMYDAREDSPTYQMVNEVYLTEYDRSLITIPRGVVHAVQNIGHETALFVSMPTKPYDHANPDKHRIPIGSDEIPYQFEDKPGW